MYDLETGKVLNYRTRVEIIEDGLVQEPRYSLDELAHFNRCMFPGDFERELVEAGIEPGAAAIYCWYFKDQDRRALEGFDNHRCVVGFYQAHISHKRLTDAVTTILEKFMEGRKRGFGATQAAP